MSPVRAWKWKWSNGVEKSEIDLFWCLSMINNVKSCKKTMEEFKLSDSVQCFWNGTSGALCQKNTRPIQTKTQITQHFEKVWPILGGTRWKGTSRAFQKCCSFWDSNVLNQGEQRCFVILQFLNIQLQYPDHFCLCSSWFYTAVHCFSFLLIHVDVCQKIEKMLMFVKK